MLSPRSPGDVPLDTSFIVNAVFQGLPDSAACAHASDMIIANQAVVYFSAILRIEYAQALRRLATKHRLPQDIHDRFDLDHWAEARVRHR